MNNKLYIIIGVCVGTLLIVLIMIHIMRKNKKSRYKKMIDNLDYQKNQLDTSPVGPELAKVEGYINNDKLEVMYKNWKERLDDIKEVKIPKINPKRIEPVNTTDLL